MRLALIAVLLLAPSLGEAQEGGDPTRAEIDRARTIFDEGTRHFEAERYLEAAHAYELAYGVVPRPLILLNAATAYERALETARAIELLERYLATAGDIDDRAALEARLAGLRALEAGPSPGVAVVQPPIVQPIVQPQIVHWPVSPLPASRAVVRRPDEIVSASGPPGLLVAGAAVGIVALFATAAAIGTGVAAIDSAAALDAMCDDALVCAAGWDAQQRQTYLLADSSTGLGITGLVVGAAAVLMIALGIVEGTPSRAAIGPRGIRVEL